MAALLRSPCGSLPQAGDLCIVPPSLQGCALYCHRAPASRPGCGRIAGAGPQQRKTLTLYADELEHWVAQGWLTGHETFVELQNMATLTELIYQEVAGSREVQAEILGIKGGFQTALASRLPPGSPGAILEALTPILDAHRGMWPGWALYWLRRQAAS